jgi:hypothetical protein
MVALDSAGFGGWFCMGSEFNSAPLLDKWCHSLKSELPWESLDVLRKPDYFTAN